MAKDPATLWYWNDWHGGTITFSRHLKGCYVDLLYAQFNEGHLSLDEIKTVLGSDFGSAWPTLQKKFKVDNDGLFYNERAEIEKNKRIAFTESRKNNLKSHKQPHMKTHKESLMENENENRNRNEIKGVQGDSKKVLKKTGLIVDETISDWEHWGKMIVEERDQFWNGRKVSQDEMDAFISIAIRCEWKMETQQSFRTTLNGFKLKSANGKEFQNGTIVNKKQQHTANIAKSVIEHYGLDQ